MEYTIRLSFLTADEKTININIPRANPFVTGAEVLSAMIRILDTEIIATRAGMPEMIGKADLITTEEFEYSL